MGQVRRPEVNFKGAELSPARSIGFGKLSYGMAGSSLPSCTSLGLTFHLMTSEGFLVYAGVGKETSTTWVLFYMAKIQMGSVCDHWISSAVSTLAPTATPGLVLDPLRPLTPTGIGSGDRGFPALPEPPHPAHSAT